MATKKTKKTTTAEPVVEPVAMEVNYQDYQDVQSIMPHSSKEETLEGGNGVIVSKQRLANAVGFDYDKQIQLLTPAQRKNYLTMANAINVNDLTSIQQYGADVSKTIEDNGNSLLEGVRSNNNNNEANQLINNLLAELKMVDIDDLQSTKIKRVLRKIPGLRNLVMTVDRAMIKYDTIKNNVDQIAMRIKQHKVIAARDNNTLQIIFDNNVEYIKEIRDLIIAAKLKEQEVLSNIDYMKDHPDEFSPIQVHDAQNFHNALTKRIADMQISEYIFNQNLFQIRAIQHNNMSISDRAESIATTVIPIWKNQLALSVIMINQQENIMMQRKANETTNKILLRNSELMKENSIAAAKANEETIASLETLQKTTKDLIDTITEVKKIQTEGAKMRQTLEHNLVEYGTQLTNQINQIAIDKK